MKKYTSLLILLLLVAALTTCKKEPDAPIGGNKIELGQTKIDTVLYFEAEVSTSLDNTGGNEITQHGHCWGTKTNPTTDNAKTTLGKLDKPEAFQSHLNGLKDNTGYFVRSYTTYRQGTVYGKEEEIHTLKTGMPVVDSTTVSNVTINSATFNSEVLADSGLIVTSRGFCWDTTNVFTISDCFDSAMVGDGLGSFSSAVIGLNEGVNYFAKAYAINEIGISYGDVKQFISLPISLPEVTTNDITDISINSATSGHFLY